MTSPIHESPMNDLFKITKNGLSYKVSYNFKSNYDSRNRHKVYNYSFDFKSCLDRDGIVGDATELFATSFNNEVFMRTLHKTYPEMKGSTESCEDFYQRMDMYKYTKSEIKKMKHTNNYIMVPICVGGEKEVIANTSTAQVHSTDEYYYAPKDKYSSTDSGVISSYDEKYLQDMKNKRYEGENERIQRVVDNERNHGDPYGG